MKTNFELVLESEIQKLNNAIKKEEAKRDLAIDEGKKDLANMIFKTIMLMREERVAMKTALAAYRKNRGCK